MAILALALALLPVLAFWPALAAAQAPAKAPAAGPKAEVVHWWTSGGESAAVKTLADAYRAAGGPWRNRHRPPEL